MSEQETTEPTKTEQVVQKAAGLKELASNKWVKRAGLCVLGAFVYTKVMEHQGYIMCSSTCEDDGTIAFRTPTGTELVKFVPEGTKSESES